jgi:hypothetical protein
MSFLESTLQAALLEAAPRELPGVRLFRRNVGVAKMRGATLRFSIPGQADIYGYIKGDPARAVEIELKSATGTLEPDQRRWRDWCVAWGVPHIVLKAKKDESVEQTVARWIVELRALVG